jgi:hypothetical protein
MPVRVSDSAGGVASWSDIAAGLHWAVDNGARVANISYQVVNSYAIREAAQRMRNAGGVVISAAGNGATEEWFSENPALVHVAATTADDGLAAYSSYGSYVDLSAPGDQIWTTMSGGGYAPGSGTSYASPVVAGVAGLVLSANPGLTSEEIEQVLEGSSDDLGAGGWDIFFGSGRVNAAGAVDLALASPDPDTMPPLVEILSPANDSTVAGTVPVEVHATDDGAVSEVVLHAGGALVGTDVTAPFQFSWDATQVADGEVALIATAYDAAGNEGRSDEVTVRVANTPEPRDTTPPRVTIDTPSDGATVSKKVVIAASASDDTGVRAIALYVNGEEECRDEAGIVSCVWNVNREPEGAHLIRAVARDLAGNETTASIRVYKIK